MTRRRQAIKAMSDALHADACTDDEHEWCDFGDWEREAEIALDAALTILQPVAPNTGEALDTLPAGSVIRGAPTRSWSGTGSIPRQIIAERLDTGDWIIVGDDCGPDSETFAKEAGRYGITEWTVLHWGDS